MARFGFAVEIELAGFRTFHPRIKVNSDYPARVIARNLDRVACHTDPSVQVAALTSFIRAEQAVAVERWQSGSWPGPPT